MKSMAKAGKKIMFVATKKQAKEIVAEMMTPILEDLPLTSGDEVLCFINGFGSTTLMELLIIQKEVSDILSAQNMTSYKALVGEYITTQEMAGFSISLCKSNEEMKRLWAAPCSVPFFHR